MQVRCRLQRGVGGNVVYELEGQLAVCLSVGFLNEKCRSGVRVLELEFEVVLRMRVQHQQPFPVVATTKMVLCRIKNPQLVLRVCSRGFPDRITD